MHLDALIEPADIAKSAEIARAAEAMGLHAVWTAETRHDPFLPLALAASATTRIRLGTAIAVAFPRSPTTMAHTAWDMAALSGGRFTLGLGTQVKAHIERRFSVAWDSPVERLREYIEAMRAVWATWRTGERLRYEGRFYSLKLMTPFFSPDPLPYPDPPIFIAGVNQGLCRLAGQAADGFLVHPLNSPRYLREAVLPWIEEGLAESGRTRQDVHISASIFAITGRGELREQARESVRRQISFYASTPTYQTIMHLHGWDEIGERLRQLASRGRWDDMAAVVSDEMLSELAIEGDTLEDAAHEILTRYTGLIDRATFYLPYQPGERDDEWRAAARVADEGLGPRG